MLTKIKGIGKGKPFLLDIAGVRFEDRNGRALVLAFGGRTEEVDFGSEAAAVAAFELIFAGVNEVTPETIKAYIKETERVQKQAKKEGKK